MTTSRGIRRRVHVLLGACGALLLAAGVAGCGPAPAKGHADEDRRTFPLSGRTLTIDVSDSAVDVVPADTSTVEVTRRLDGWVVLGRRPSATWRMSGHTLTLDVHCSGVVVDCSARHEVKVPRNVAVTVRTTDGPVEAAGFTSALSVHSDDGRLHVRDTSGPLSLSTDDGSITASGIRSEAVTARSGNGSISLAASAVPDRVTVADGNGSVSVRLPRTRYAVSATSGNGSVHVGVDRDPASRHVVTARTGNGSVSVGVR